MRGRFAKVSVGVLTKPLAARETSIGLARPQKLVLARGYEQSFQLLGRDCLLILSPAAASLGVLEPIALATRRASTG